MANKKEIYIMIRDASIKIIFLLDAYATPPENNIPVLAGFDDIQFTENLSEKLNAVYLKEIETKLQHEEKAFKNIVKSYLGEVK